jgi:hypothetical protein
MTTAPPKTTSVAGAGAGKSRTGLHVAKLVLLLPLLLYLAFILPEKKGYWDHVMGLDSVREVADRFERSVGPDDAVPVRAGDKEFNAVVTLIKKYSLTKLAVDKTPQVVARMQAKVYDAQPLGQNGKLAQWTSPATPIAVMYFDWPNVRFPSGAVPDSEYAIVGTLGDLHEWINRSHEDLHFEVVDLLLVGFVPLMVGLYEYLVELRYEKKDRP